MIPRLRSGLQSRIDSFRYAFAGWSYVLRTQRNAWIHALLSLAAIALAMWLRLPAQDWALLILTMTVVWMAEFANTALETLVDLTTPGPHPLAKTAKDVAAAAVLVGAIGAAIIGLLVLGPPLWHRLIQ